MMLPELLAPAGNALCAIAAIQNGADAVYLGLKQGSARVGADNFTWQELEETLQYAHRRACRVYLALNTLFTEEELPKALDDAKRASELGVDALIVQDIGFGGYWRYVTISAPCYYVSYSISALSVLQLYADVEERGFEATKESYLKLFTYTDENIEMTTEEVLEYAGLHSFTEEELYVSIGEMFAKYKK